MVRIEGLEPPRLMTPGFEPGASAHFRHIRVIWCRNLNDGAGGENRTPNLLITSELPYHSATPAELLWRYVFGASTGN